MKPFEPSPTPEEAFASIFRDHGWAVEQPQAESARRLTPDLVLTKKRLAYVAEVKSASEGRPDRVIPQLAHAILQAQTYARPHGRSRPLALVWVRNIQPTLLQKVDEFCSDFATGTAVGIASADGVRHFVGEGLESLNSEAGRSSTLRPVNLTVRGAGNLYSDLNQWLLKVLLAPEIPVNMLTAPRGERYRTTSDLAKAADVSLMTAARFVTTLREEGFLDNTFELRLVRRRELSRRWKSHYTSPTPEAPMRFLIPGNPQAQLPRLLGVHEGCVGLFAAADLLNVGHVQGVPPYLYVRNLVQASHWKELVPDAHNPRPALIVKQASAPNSLLRGAVQKHGLFIADVLQIWLDALSHPSRGEEQSLQLEHTVLRGIVGEDA